MESNNLYKDPVLHKIIDEVDPPVIDSTNAVFHDMMSCIIEQQIHYRSSKRIFAKALERAGIQRLTLDNFHLVEKYSFPHIKLSTGRFDTMMAFVDY